MDLTIIQSSVTLFMILCVIIVFASIFMRSRFFKEIFEGHPTLTTQVIVMFFFGILSIFGTLSGLSVYGAVVNIRDLGPMAAGLLCGPYIGLGAGIIGGLFRFAQGGPYMWTGLSAPILSGVLGGVMYLANKRQFVPTWVAVVLIGLSETLISCYTLILVTKPAEFYTVVTMVAIPMVVFNVIGMFIFATTVHHILDEMKVRKQVQQLELEVESRRNLNTIINTIAYPVYVLDRDHRFTLVNDSICRFIGQAREEILGKTPRDFFNEEDSAIHFEMTENVFTTHIPREDEVIITRANGLKCFLISTSTIYKDITGQEFMVGVIHDITERKKAQDALQQANRQLKLLSGITRHDINNNITAILGLISLAEMDSKDPSMAEYFRDIETATREIRSQIEFTKVYQDLGTHEPQWQDLHRTITSGSHVPGDISLSVHVPGVELYADPMLEKVFFNLIDNSIRHGEHVTEIRVSAEQSDGGLIVVFEDNGTGIPVDQKEKIFLRGFGKNTGFGLFLVREILTLTGITITETGVQGKGARFEIRVPGGAFRLTIPE